MKLFLTGGMVAASAILGLSTATLAAPPQPAAGAAVHAPVRATQEAMTEQRIADLHAKLAISAAQQPEWDAFTAVMRDNAKTMEATFNYRLRSMPTMTATENMRSYAEVAMDHAQEVQKLVPALENLYATMSDSQKHTADQLFRAGAGNTHHG